MDASGRAEEVEREKDERRREIPESRERKRGGGSLVARANTLAYSVRSLIIFPVAAEGKVAAAGCYYPEGEWKDIVISRRRSSLAKQPPALLHATAEHRHRAVNVAASSTSSPRERDEAGGGMWTNRAFEPGDSCACARS